MLELSFSGSSRDLTCRIRPLEVAEGIIDVGISKLSEFEVYVDLIWRVPKIGVPPNHPY